MPTVTNTSTATNEASPIGNAVRVYADSRSVRPKKIRCRSVKSLTGVVSRRSVSRI